MEITAILSNVAVYGLQYKLDVKVNENLTFLMDKPDEMDDVFVNNDKVLDFERQGSEINMQTKAVGVSKVRIMKDVTIVREFLLNVVNDIPRPATSLNVTFGEAMPK